MNKVKRMDDAEIRISGIETLNKQLGPATAHRFLALLNREPTDYLVFSQRLYEGQTLEDIFDRAEKQWRG